MAYEPLESFVLRGLKAQYAPTQLLVSLQPECQEIATHRYFLGHAGKYTPLLSRLFSILRPSDKYNNKSIMGLKNVVVMLHMLVHKNTLTYIDITLKSNLGSEGGTSCLRMWVRGDLEWGSELSRIRISRRKDHT